ncbi:RICIN domain-containing protein, partial [Streptomyces sp. T21Q-yed]
SGKDVVIRYASRDAGAKAVQYPYEANANANDEWLAEDAGNGRIRLLNRHSGFYLTAGNAQGDQLEQRPFDGADHQLFTVS